MPDKKIDLTLLEEEELLRLKISDLPIRLEGTWLEDCVGQLYSELEQNGVRFRPVCYLADEWLTPDGEPVVGIPFYLAHPVLMKLEKKMVLEVEGGTKQWCMKLLRHETGHAINYAFKLHRRKKWHNIFGPFSKEYEDTYRFRPYSKNFVRHLEDYYAQYHPDEDFAETFAVWLTPDLDWRAQYKGWKALDKLEYVNELMKDIADKSPQVPCGKKYWAAAKLRITLKTFYKKKRLSYEENFPDFHDANLKKIFSVWTEDQDKKTSRFVADVIKKYKKDIRNNVSAWTGEKKYIIDDLLNTIGERCRALRLLAAPDEALTILNLSSYITSLIMKYLYTGNFRGDR
ncbi:MAG: hypothetical protein JXD21_01625 [Candidatus Omnitrophica bacterium]|nr:hypothetical protein [Candidatus Omnitrophota bacterium]